MFRSQNLQRVHKATTFMLLGFLSGFIYSLLVYALLWEAGNIVTSGCKQIGFYNFCLYNENSAGCYCISHVEELVTAGVTFPYGLVLALVFTYSSLVTLLWAIISLSLALYLNERSLLVFAQVCNILSLTGLTFGPGIFLFLTRVLLSYLEFSNGFLALILAVVGQMILCIIMRHYISQTYWSS
ncbi:transmembrane protein 140 [Rhinophrynus dorsalis]